MSRIALTRTPGTGIKIGNDIIVEIVSVAGNQVRIRTHAPRDVNVSRVNDQEVREFDAERS